MSTSPNAPYHSVGDFYPRKFGSKPDVVPSGVTERKVVPLDKPDMVTVDVLNVTEAGLLCYMLMANNTSHSRRLSVRLALFSDQNNPSGFIGIFFLVVGLKGTCLLTVICFYLLTAAGCDHDRRRQIISSRHVIYLFLLHM